MQIFHAGKCAHRIDAAGRSDVLDLSASPLFTAYPNLLEQMVEVDTVVHGNALVDREMPVDEFDASVGLLRDVWVVRDHQNGVAAGVQLAKQPEDDLLIGLVEVPSGFIGKDQFRLIDQRPGDGDALLFAAGKLRRKVRQSVAEPDAFQGIGGLRFIRDAVEILRQHDIFERAEIRYEMKLLKDESNFFCAVANQIIFPKFCELHAVDDDVARARAACRTLSPVSRYGPVCSPFTSKNTRGTNARQAAKRKRTGDGNENCQAHCKRIDDPARLRGHTEDCFSQPD
jgi:hypothetical protein